MRLNNKQIEALQEEWELGTHPFYGRPSPDDDARVAARLSTLGEPVTAEIVHTLFNKMVVSPQKPPFPSAPPHIVILENAFLKNPNPDVRESILLVHKTGKSRHFVTTWFDKERKRARQLGFRTDNLSTSRHKTMLSNRQIAAMWAEYEKNPEAYVHFLKAGVSSKL